MAKQVLCLGECREWFDASFHWCPTCEWERPRYNSHMYRVALDNDLYRKAESGQNEMKLYEAAQQGYDIPVSKQVQKRAKQIVADL